MTGVFGTPIAAVMLAVELLLFEWTPTSFVPVAVAAVVAETGRVWLGLPTPLFPFVGAVAISAPALATWCLVGLASGLLACVLTRLVYLCEDGFGKLPIHWMWWPVIGGLAVGLGGAIDPRALGVGYDNIAAMLGGGLAGGPGVKLLVVKAVIWAVALGSGTSGGVLAPLLMIGGALGAVAGPFLPAAAPGFWALLAMAATMGGAMRSPLTATFFAVELTGNDHLLVPALAACATAHLCTVLLMRRSILTEKVARRGHHITREYRVDPFALTRAGEIMTKSIETVPSSMTLHEAARLFTQADTRHPSFPVVDENGHVKGVIDPPTVLALRRSGKHRRAVIGELLGEGRGAPYVVAAPTDYIEALIDRMSEANAARAVVVSGDDQRLVGYVTWKDILGARVSDTRTVRRPPLQTRLTPS
jgi:CBS domain-containing protein